MHRTTLKTCTTVLYFLAAKLFASPRATGGGEAEKELGAQRLYRSHVMQDESTGALGPFLFFFFFFFFSFASTKIRLGVR